MVPAGLKNYQDLLNPAFKGRIGTRQDMTAFLAAFLDWQEQAFGVDFMRKFGAQKPKYYPSVVPMTQAVASGEIWIANTSIPSIAKDLKLQGAPIDFVVPAKTFAIQWPAGALAASRRPNAARVFVNFLMTEPGQLALNGDGDGGSPLQVKGTLRPEDLTILELEKYDGAKREEWRKKFKEYFN
jgi:iron(III) transport system substrate-binding protein